MSSVEIDVQDYRIAISEVELSTRDGAALVIPQLRLDTGSAFHLIAPLKVLEDLHPAPERWADRVDGFGGSLPAEVFEATLKIGAWVQHVDVHAIETDHWYLGLPVLKHFHLCLRPDARHISWLVGPEHPT